MFFGRQMQCDPTFALLHGCTVGHKFGEACHWKPYKYHTPFAVFLLATSNLELVYITAAQPCTPLVGTIKKAFGKKIYRCCVAVAIVFYLEYFFQLSHYILYFCLFIRARRGRARNNFIYIILPRQGGCGVPAPPKGALPAASALPHRFAFFVCQKG